MQLNEGLRANDLVNLVKNVISIDEFHSKLDDEKSIVVGFYVDDREPARDLSRFIEKSAFEVIDTEISPAPDEHGHYMMFMELYRKKNFVETLMDVIEIVKPLTGIDKFYFKTYKNKNKFPVTKRNLKKYINTKTDPEKKKETLEALQYSDLNEAKFVRTKLVLNNTNYEFVDFDKTETVFSKYGKDVNVFETDNHMQFMLGSNWAVHKSGEFIIAGNDKHSLVVKKSL